MKEKGFNREVAKTQRKGYNVNRRMNNLEWMKDAKMKRSCERIFLDSES